MLRWWLGLGLNAIWPMLPLGTLLANWIGGYVIGVLAPGFAANPGKFALAVELHMPGLTVYIHNGAVSQHKPDCQITLRTAEFWVLGVKG